MGDRVTDAGIPAQLATAQGAAAGPSAAGLSQRFAAAAAKALLEREAGAEELRRAFHRDRRATLEELCPLANSWCREEIRRFLQRSGDSSTGSVAVADAVFLEPAYLERVVHLTLERVLVNRAAPPLLVSPVPAPESAALLREHLAVAVLFDHPLAITHELYPLWTDAYVFCQNTPTAPPLALIGVHLSWLDTECRARRAIVFDSRADVFLEAPMGTPEPLGLALLLCQSRQAHRQLSARLVDADMPHINVYEAAAEVADDKWACYRRWQERGVATPPTCLLARGEARDPVRRAIDDFLQRHRGAGAGWMVQPRRGTEGERVTWVRPGDRARMVEGVLRCWEELAPGDDAVLRPRVGLVGLRSAEGRGARPFDLRLHVSWDGTAHHAESGYLLVAPGPDEPVASVSQGGHVEPLTALDGAGLVCGDADSGSPAVAAAGPAADPSPAAGAELTWGRDELDAARELAIRATTAVGTLALAGVDIKLDLHGGRLVPSVLDVNPRPAGLLHSDLLAGVDGGTALGEAGIGAGLWRGVVAALRA